MKHLLSILFVTVLLCSCENKTKCKAVFSSIDVSYGNAWTMKMSVHIDSSQVAHVLIDSLNKGKMYYIGTINDSAFCTINALVNTALTENYDQVVGEQAPDAGVSGIEIIAKHKKVRTLLLSSHAENTLDTIITQLSILRNFNLTKDAKNPFTFSSYDIITPKIVPVEFVPPVINEDVLVK